MNVIILFVFGDGTFFLTFIDYWICILQIHLSNNLKVHIYLNLFTKYFEVKITTQLTFTCSKSAIETLEKGVINSIFFIFIFFFCRPFQNVLVHIFMATNNEIRLINSPYRHTNITTFSNSNLPLQ